MRGLVYVLYHDQCMDGFGAAFAAWVKLGYENVKYIAVTHGRPLPEIKDGSTVYILDFSYSREVLLELSKRTTLTVIDHHKTAEKELKGLSFAKFDMNKSGAVLSWEYFHAGTGARVPRMLNYIQDRDLWEWKLESSREISAYLASLPKHFELWNTTAHMFYSDMPTIVKGGEAILRSENQRVMELAKNTLFMDIGKYEGIPAINTSVFISDCCKYLLDQYPFAPFTVCYFDQEGQRTISMRSRGDFDVGDLAKEMGGGGHKAAAGFQIKEK